MKRLESMSLIQHIAEHFTRLLSKCFWFVFFGVTVVFLESLQATPALVSPDGTFVLYGSDLMATREFSRVLASYEKNFNQLTGYSPGDAPPVVVVMYDETSNSQHQASLKMDSVEGNTPRIEVDIPFHAATKPMTGTSLAQGMLLRQYYNGKTSAAGSRIVEFPPWLLHGLGRLSNPNAKLVTIPSSYLHGAAPPSIPDLLLQKAPDGSNAALLDVYDTMAAALLKAGFQETKGGWLFRDWVGVFDPSASVRQLSSWPAGWSMQSVERRWLLLMASIGAEDTGGRILSVSETLSRYDNLRAGIATVDHSLAPLKKQRGGAYLLQQFNTQLIALRLQANPLLDSLLQDNILLCTQWKHLSEKKIIEKEKKTSLQREQILKRSRAIDDYMDWFEASKLPVQSGLFEHILDAPDSPVQKGPIGHYLDTVESRGW